MATISTITENAFFNLSKAFPQSPNSIFPSPKVSRVCFTSASKYSESRNAADEPGRYNKNSYTSSESDNDIEDRASEMAGKAKENLPEGVEKTKDKAQEMKEKTKHTTYETNESCCRDHGR